MIKTIKYNEEQQASGWMRSCDWSKKQRQARTETGRIKGTKMDIAGPIK